MIKDDLRAYLSDCNVGEQITEGEIDAIIRRLEAHSTVDLYDSNQAIHEQLADGFLLQRKDRARKDLYIQLIEYVGLSEQGMFVEEEMQTAVAEGPADCYTDQHIYRLVDQLEIEGGEKRIPDAILYFNGLPLVVFELKSAIRAYATIHDAYVQLTTRHTRDIPVLMKFNALCVISDGVNSRMGSLFAPYEFYCTWRKVTGNESIEVDGISALHSIAWARSFLQTANLKIISQTLEQMIAV